MLGAILLPEQPRAQGLALLWRKRDRLGGEGFDGERGHPGGEICVDGPAPVRPRRRAQKLRALPRHGMFREAHRRKAHGHETRQRHGFEEAAVFRLDGRQHAQRPRPRALAEEVGERVPRRAVVMDRLPDRDERRQRVADHRQPQRAENLVRQRRQLEGQRHDVLPADASAEREGHQDRHGKSAVLAVARGDGGGECACAGACSGGSARALACRPRRPRLGHEARSLRRVITGFGEGAETNTRGRVRSPFQPCARGLHDFRIFPIRPRRAKRRPAERRGADVAFALHRVAPAAVRVLRPRQPPEPAANHVPISFPPELRQRHHRRRRRERTARKLARPMPVRRQLPEQRRRRQTERHRHVFAFH